ncbi:MAG: carbohydrate ABC transporter permease [Eubacteriales bacterium]|nr:carbohydrate ABC transporter permease [Eubacteriales bacterium]
MRIGKKKNHIHVGMRDRIFLILVHAYLLLSLLMVLYPLIYVVSASFSSPHAVISGQVWLYPVEPTLEGYIRVFQNQSFLSGLRNSLFLLVCGTLCNIVMTILAAYPLSRKKFALRKPLMFLFVFFMIFTPGIVPMYMVIRNLNLIDSYLALILPSALSAYYVIITRTFFESSIPEAIYESAKLDGASEFKVLRHIVLPLAKPILAVLALMYGVGHWNSYFNALMYINTQEKFPLALVLRQILIQNTVDISSVADMKTMMELEGMRDLLKYSMIVISSIPILAFYPFVQKYFAQGMMLGAVKE